ncbi:MAG: beta-ketoacyl-ACP synthase III [Deltaproteobacteria bacterium]
MTPAVYINDIAGFLPNEPIGNDEIEHVLGMVGGKPSRSKKLVLRNNGIKTRYYAIDPQTGKYTHNNAQMTAEAVRALSKKSGFNLNDMEVLSCGTSSPDQFKPAHGQMVQGELGCPPCEVITTAGVCSSGMTAMKYGYMNVALGLSKTAVCAGSEFASSFMRGANFEPEIHARIDKLEKHPELGFEKDFLRWMLSDGAGAALISSKPNQNRISLRIDWIDYLSFAGDMQVCMYSGAIKQEDGYLKGWREADDPLDIIKQGYFSSKQDARLLDKHIISVSVERALLPIAAKRGLRADEIVWFLPHYSSEYFREKLYNSMASNGFNIPFNRWFTNLTVKGNVGAASIYLIIEELLYSGRLKKGDRLLCYIPESARFSICYMLLTVV